MRNLLLVSLAVSFAGCTCSSAPTTRACDNTQLLTGCTVGRCTVSSRSSPLPPNGFVTVSERPVPPEVGADSAGPSMCELDFPKEVAAADLTLAITADSPPSDGVLFSFRDGLARAVKASGPVGSRVQGPVSAPGLYGVTETTGAWTIEGYVGSDRADVYNTASLLRNLSNQAFTAGAFDGLELVVGNGPRLLIYKSVLPGLPNPPDVLLGQPDLQSALATTSASLFNTNGALSSVWSDGKRLVASSGNRVLVWNQFPTSTLAPADVVLGQPDFVTNKPNGGGVSASTFSGATQVDSDGNQLVVGDALNHRVLVWKTFPNAVAQPADTVIGQPDFQSAVSFGGNTPLYIPYGAAFAAAQSIWVTSTGGPGLARTSTNTNAPIDFSVFGWLFSGNQPGQQLARPGQIWVSADNRVAVRDYSMNFVAVTKPSPTTPSAAAFVLGQPDSSRMIGVSYANAANNNPSRVSASTFGGYPALGGGQGTLIVPDDRRLLVWNPAPSYNFEPATHVVGQAGFTVNERNDYRSVSAVTLAQPTDIAVAGDTSAVADRGNNRVLLYKTLDLTTNNALPKAAVIIGQPDESSFVANGDILTPSAKGLSGPSAVALDGTHLVVADTENHRVLLWNKVPTTSGAAADLVLGQQDFSGRRPNKGRKDGDGDGYSDAAADGFFYPTDVASDGTHLLVVDRMNSRVLVWDSWPTTSGQAASRVLGQPDFQAVKPHRNTSPFDIKADGFNLPTAIELAGSTLYVADTENNRVVRWDDVFGSPKVGAVFGQPDGVTVTNANYRFSKDVYRGTATDVQATSAASVLRPRGLTLVSGKLFVSEIDSNRVHVLDASSLASIAVLGQGSDTGRQPNAGGVSASSLAEPMGLASDGQRLWVADSRNHRVLGYPLQVSTGIAADRVVGQASMLTNGFNQGSQGDGGVTAQPRGVAVVGQDLFVADTNNNRVYVTDAKLPQSMQPKRVYGQPNGTLTLPNQGGAPTAATLSAPSGVWANETTLMIADTNNNRVLVFDRTSQAPDAARVLGQPGFDGDKPNQGGAASLATMRQPTAVCSDGTHVFVVDTGNNRVLGWSAAPASNGAPASFVLGQPDGASTLGNQGGPASASTMASPGGCLIAGGALYAADTANNRVLRWSAIPTSGAPADAVLGQMDFKSRAPAASVLDVDHLAGPLGLASDGTNLLVTDRDLGRVLVWTGATTGKPTLVLGGLGGPSLLRGSGGVAVQRGPLFTTRIFVAETANDRVAVVNPISRLLP